VEVREAMAAAGKMEVAVKGAAVERVEGEIKVKETVEAMGTVLEMVTVLEMAEDVVVKTMGIAAVAVGRPRGTGIRVTGAAEEILGASVVKAMEMAAGKAAETTQPLAARTSERVAV
jgi:hypothetical protein